MVSEQETKCAINSRHQTKMVWHGVVVKGWKEMKYVCDNCFYNRTDIVAGR